MNADAPKGASVKLQEPLESRGPVTGTRPRSRTQGQTRPEPPDGLIERLAAENRITDHMALRYLRRERTAIDWNTVTVLRRGVFMEIPRRCAQLQHVKLQFCKQVNNRVVRALLENCRDLQVLRLDGCRNVSDTAFSSRPFELLHGLLGLVEVGISQCPQVTCATIETLLKHCAKLRVLDIARNRHFQNHTIASALESFRELEVINLEYCAGLTPDLFTLLSSQPPQSCSPPDSNAAECEAPLDSLKGSLRNGRPSEGNRAPGQGERCTFHELPLKELRWGGLPVPAHYSLSFPHVFSRLKVLDLRWCPGVTDDVLHSLLGLDRQHKGSVEQGRKTGSLPAYAGQNTRPAGSLASSLETISLRGCAEITHNSLHSLRACRALKNVDVSWCFNLSPVCILQAFETHSLESLNMSFCCGMSNSLAYSECSESSCASEVKHPKDKGFVSQPAVSSKEDETSRTSVYQTELCSNTPHYEENPAEGGEPMRKRLRSGSNPQSAPSDSANGSVPTQHTVTDNAEASKGVGVLPLAVNEKPVGTFPGSPPLLPRLPKRFKMGSKAVPSQDKWWNCSPANTTPPSCFVTRRQKLTASSHGDSGTRTSTASRPESLAGWLAAASRERAAAGRASPRTSVSCRSRPCCPADTAAALEALGSLSRTLKTLKLDGIECMITPKFLKGISQCTAVRSVSLRLEAGQRHTEEAAVDGSEVVRAFQHVGVSCSTSLKKLRLEVSSSFSPEYQTALLVSCLPKFTSLEKLALKFPDLLMDLPSPTDAYMFLFRDIIACRNGVMASKLSQIQLFNIPYIHSSLNRAALGVDPLEYLQARIDNTKILVISGCLDLEDSDVLLVSFPVQPVVGHPLCRAMPFAQHLCFLHCPKLTEACYTCVTSSCRALKSVHIMNGTFKKRIVGLLPQSKNSLGPSGLVSDSLSGPHDYLMGCVRCSLDSADVSGRAGGWRVGSSCLGQAGSTTPASQASLMTARKSPTR